MINNPLFFDAYAATAYARVLQQAETARYARISQVKGTNNVGGFADERVEESSRQPALKPRAAEAPAPQFSDLYAGQFLYSSVAFLQAFSLGDSPLDADAREAASNPYQQPDYELEDAAEEAQQLNLFGAEIIENEQVQEVLPPLSGDSSFNNFTGIFGGDSPRFVLQDEFSVARESYAKAIQLRQRAFASPPSINLLG